MPVDYPNQDFYPSALLRFSVRLDEFGDANSLKAAPKKTTQNLDGTYSGRADLAAVVDLEAAQVGVHRFLLVPAGQTGAANPTDQATSTDGYTHDFVVLPHELDWTQNGIRAASQLSASFRAADAPIDPRVCRSVAVTAIIGCVSADDFAAGIAGERREKDGMLKSVVPDTWVDAKNRQRTNVRFRGWVDKWRAEWPQGDQAMIHIECRDNTQLLIEQEAPPKLVLDANKPIDEAVATYLSHFNQFQGLSVEYRPNNLTPPMLKSVLTEPTATRPNLGPPPGQGGGGKQRLAVWDYLTDACGALAHSIYVDGLTVVIVLVRSLMSNNLPVRSDDPMRDGRDLPGTGRHLDRRTFIYGRNVRTMNVSRNFVKKAPANVEVRSYSGSNKSQALARFPLPDDRQKLVIPGDAQPDQKWVVYRAPPGVTSIPALRAYAQTIYESVGRNEIEATVTTANAASYGGGNDDPDLLDIKFGDSFDLLMNRSDDESSTFTSYERDASAEAINTRLFQDLGFSEEFAKNYARAYANIGYPTTFRTKSMKVHFETGGGFTFDVQGVNYIEVRSNVSLPDGEEVGTTPSDAQGTKKTTNP
jgi:hypothetical protein